MRWVEEIFAHHLAHFQSFFEGWVMLCLKLGSDHQNGGGYLIIPWLPYPLHRRYVATS